MSPRNSQVDQSDPWAHLCDIVNAPSFNLDLLGGHLAASFCTTAARLGTAFTVIHIMRAALFRAPVADVRAQLAGLLGERTIAGHCIGTQSADRRALDAASRAIIHAFLADHVGETVAAFGRAIVTGGNAVFGALVQMMTHGVFP